MNNIQEFYLDKMYSKGTSRKEDKDIEDSKKSHPYQELDKDGKAKHYINKKVAGAAGAVVGAGVGMAASNRNLKEWKALKAKDNKTPAEKARQKHLRRLIGLKVGSGALVGGASASYLARK